MLNIQFKNLLKEYKELILYLVVGILTTLVSLGSYYILTKTIFDPKIEIELQCANVISWMICVTFAYFMNRKYVFESRNKSIIKEGIKFYSSRIFSLLLDMLIMFIGVSIFNYNDRIIKLLVQVIVTIVNYITGKFIVFVKEKHNEK